MLELELEKRTHIKFIVKFGKSRSEISKKLLQVHGANAMKKAAVYKLVTRFSEGRESVTDKVKSGRPATSRIEENFAKFHQIVRKNCQLSGRSMPQQANINREIVGKILTEDLDMKKVCAKMFPKDLLTRHCCEGAFS
ncbi:protein GVQW3-like [Cryptotermes secundus]|uniref:protein GVQW3-like n=1 Tax=Cryptotermes secundus TaxID=105785 RepID=UPI000CD7D418|nr:protein GVQW3-like [Cryptotermes secundus]